MPFVPVPPFGAHRQQLSPGLTCSLQLLLGTLVKLTQHPELRRLPRTERISVAVSTWPQLWVLHLVQSGIDVARVFECGVAKGGEQALKLAKMVDEFRSLKLDQAEWGLVEALVMGGRGDLTMSD